MKKYLITGILTFTVLLIYAHAQENESITQGQAAKLIAYHLGLYDFLPANPTPEEAISMLMANGISPQEKWEVNKILTRADFAKILVEAMGKGDEITNKDRPESYIRYLLGLGITIDSFSEAMNNIDPDADPQSSGAYSSFYSTDPLDERSVVGLPDERSQGTEVTYEPSLQLVEETSASAASATSVAAVSAATVSTVLEQVELSSETVVRSPVTPN